MKLTDRKWLSWAIVVALIVLSTITGVNFPIPPPPDEQIQAAGYTHLSGLVVAAPTTFATATPGAIINSSGLGVLFEIQDGATPVARFNDGGGLTILSGGFTATAGGATITAGGLTISDGDLVVADDIRITAQSVITVTMNGYITPTGTYQPIAAAGTVGTSNLAAGTAGNILTLINTTAQAITITDTGTLKLTGNAVLNQYDSLLLWSDGTNWVEVAQADN